LLQEADAVALACHVGPDGDALGAMLAVASAATKAGKRVQASFGSPFTLPETYRFLPLHLLVPPKEFPAEPTLMVCFDAGSLDRLGELAGPASRAATLVVVDHHASNTRFGAVNLIDPGAAASAQLAYRLINAAGWDIDPEVATCLHVGLVTDTGRFQYSNTTPEVLEVAARLVEAGARPEVIGRHVYEEAPFGYLRAAAAVLGRAVLEADRRWVWSILRRSDLEEAGIGLEDTDSLIDALRVAREAEVAVLVKEHPDGNAKASLRSRGEVDVGAIAVDLGGGGHHNASGFTYEGTAEAAVAAVRERLPLA
ncbi:MAG: DHH family phosphoesterase, partial [Acidimicrobiia bacterium]